MGKKLRLRATRKVYPYLLLWNRCRWAFEDSKEHVEFEYLYLYSMLLCAFTLEAYLNHLGKLQCHEYWPELESKRPIEKLDEISSIIGLQLDRSRRPSQTFKEIFEFRNDIVHAKPAEVIAEIEYPVEEFLKADELPPEPPTDWEKALNPDKANRFFQDTEAMIIFLHKGSGLGDKPFEGTFSRTRWEGNI